jgi:hypothetical protein
VIENMELERRRWWPSWILLGRTYGGRRGGRQDHHSHLIGREIDSLWSYWFSSIATTVRIGGI